jgi:hypothetical protein
MFDKNRSNSRSIFPKAAVRGGNDTHHCDPAIILLTSCTSTISPEAMYGLQVAEHLPVPDSPTRYA